MDLKTAILSRRTVHEFSGESVPQDLIEEALNLALWAPNHKLTYPWMFYLIGRETQMKLVELAVEIKAASPKPPSEVMLGALRQKLSNIPQMVAIGCKKVDDNFQQREDYATVACGVQNASLYLHEQGYASKWSTGGFTRNKKTYEILGVDSAQIDIVGFMFVGKGSPPPKKQERPALESVMVRVP
ncbi:MAG: nitroreductase [Bdellovibrionales bacterium]|nr:nitroreductase [Bdellovibrionales bacterium]